MAGGWNVYLGAIREQTLLSGRIRELLTLRVASLTNCEYEWDAHAAVARGIGVAEEEIHAARTGEIVSPSQDLELIIAVADAITERTTMSDEVFAQLEQRFTPQEILEVVATVATYNMVSRVLNALQIA